MDYQHHHTSQILPASTVANNKSIKFSVQDVGFFEGTEKLLEIWFHFESDSMGLRTISRSFWEELLDIAGCRILSEIHSNCIDAYLLSESSMFITRNRFILKTCGTISILNTVKPLLKLVKETFPKSEVKDVFYSHCPFMKPDLQFHPYQSFDKESSYLDEIFENGASYVMGKANGNCWYLYLIESVEHPLSCPDQTLEIVMTKMDSEFMGKFSKIAYQSAEDLNKSIGLDSLLPGSMIDAYVFDPCGYSLNAIVKSIMYRTLFDSGSQCSYVTERFSNKLKLRATGQEDDKYFTIHVTPQEECAYASFETNIVDVSYKELINKVLRIFKPGEFTLTLFANKSSSNVLMYDQDNPTTSQIKNYTCQDRQVSSFSLYNLTFMYYKHK